MATNTTRLGLIKPDLTDNVDIGDINDNMDDIDDAVGAKVVTSTTRPAVPFDGQLIFETDTNKTLVWDGVVWKETSGNILVPQSGNAIINGDFDIWQRGTSFSSAGFEYTADRWMRLSASDSVTRQAFTPADLTAIGYGDATFFLRYAKTSAEGFSRISQKIEDVRKFSGQQITLSFWAKGTNTSSGSNLRSWFQQDFGSGGSSFVEFFAPTFSLTSSWQRFTFTVNVPSISGKTIGANSFLSFFVGAYNNTATYTLDIWGVQIEAGPVATPFKLAGGGSKQAELALCQRYYQSFGGDDDFEAFGVMMAAATTVIRGPVELTQKMRISPSFNQVGSIRAAGSTNVTMTLSIQEPSSIKPLLFHTGSGFTTGQAFILQANSDTSARINFDAEL
jgi:hypothetical protein